MFYLRVTSPFSLVKSRPPRFLRQSIATNKVGRLERSTAKAPRKGGTFPYCHQTGKGGRMSCLDRHTILSNSNTRTSDFVTTDATLVDFCIARLSWNKAHTDNVKEESNHTRSVIVLNNILLKHSSVSCERTQWTCAYVTRQNIVANHCLPVTAAPMAYNTRGKDVLSGSCPPYI